MNGTPPTPPPMRQVYPGVLRTERFIRFLFIMVFLVGLVTAAAFAVRDDLKGEVRRSVPDILIGNPSTMQLYQLRRSPVDEKVICGSMTFERSDGPGWSGRRNFIAVNQVIYVERPETQAIFEKTCSPAAPAAGADAKEPS